MSISEFLVCCDGENLRLSQDLRLEQLVDAGCVERGFLSTYHKFNARRGNLFHVPVKSIKVAGLDFKGRLGFSRSSLSVVSLTEPIITRSWDEVTEELISEKKLDFKKRVETLFSSASLVSLKIKNIEFGFYADTFELVALLEL